MSEYESAAKRAGWCQGEEQIEHYSPYQPGKSHHHEKERRGTRKPIYATSEERKMRNRQAQASFRERRKEYIKQLETTLKEQEEALRELQKSQGGAADELNFRRCQSPYMYDSFLDARRPPSRATSAWKDQASHVLSPTQKSFDGEQVTEHDRLNANIEEKWILNLSMHFRDKSDREKFFISYPQKLNNRIRSTVSFDSSQMKPDLLGSDLRKLQHQKSFQDINAVRKSLPDTPFYDTITSSKHKTARGYLSIQAINNVDDDHDHVHPPRSLLAQPRRIEEDSVRFGIPSGYSLKNWDPAESPILLLGNVFDANSLGKWIYDWTVFKHDSAGSRNNWSILSKSAVSSLRLRRLSSSLVKLWPLLTFMCMPTGVTGLPMDNSTFDASSSSTPWADRYGTAMTILLTVMQDWCVPFFLTLFFIALVCNPKNFRGDGEYLSGLLGLVFGILSAETYDDVNVRTPTRWAVFLMSLACSMLYTHIMCSLYEIRRSWKGRVTTVVLVTMAVAGGLEFLNPFKSITSESTPKPAPTSVETNELQQKPAFFTWLPVCYFASTFLVLGYGGRFFGGRW